MSQYYNNGRYKKTKQEPAAHWWKRRLGIGNKAGEGAHAKARKKALDERIKKGGG